MRRDARLALRLVLNQHIRPRPAATQTTAAPRLRRLGLRLATRSAEESIRYLAHGNEDILTNEHWVACTKLVADIRAAGGTWTAYRRQSRKDVLRLRSLVLRGRTKDAADPVVARVLRLPNEMCWNVLKFWRATSAATGEVI